MSDRQACHVRLAGRKAPDAPAAADALVAPKATSPESKPAVAAAATSFFTNPPNRLTVVATTNSEL
jgi:hypothetical protein